MFNLKGVLVRGLVLGLTLLKRDRWNELTSLQQDQWSELTREWGRHLSRADFDASQTPPDWMERAKAWLATAPPGRHTFALQLYVMNAEHAYSALTEEQRTHFKHVSALSHVQLKHHQDLMDEFLMRAKAVTEDRLGDEVVDFVMPDDWLQRATQWIASAPPDNHYTHLLRNAMTGGSEETTT